jgi:serine/tyrosine/threonine adenylyltransferase
MLQAEQSGVAVSGGAQKIPLAFGDSYARLPAHFYTRIDPTHVADPRLIKFNSPLAADLGLDVRGLGDNALAAIFSGNVVVPDSRPIAMVYAGHQFGQFVPQLGDGRAILLGDVRDLGGRRRDIQLKGSGRTPYSRSGDGRAALGPVLREYLVSEAMHALGLPTSRALAAVATGEVVYRAQAVPGAILTRVAASHVRVGTFQYFAARGDTAATKQLADYVIERHFPEVGSASNPYLELLRSVMRRQARLVAGWMSVGFIHGVMNTDNMAISGETIDFGPCAFMDAYDPATVFSSIDHMGRYAYENQPAATQWNLARFAETLLPMIDSLGDRAIELATAVVADFSKEFDAHWLAGMRRKLGLFAEEDGDLELIGRLLDVMQRNHADFTLTFRRLCAAAESSTADADLHALFAEPAAFQEWAQVWRSRLARESQPGSEHAAFMRLVNPAVIPRNHRVEAIIVAAVAHGDYAPFEELSRVLSRPYEDRPSAAAFAHPPLPEERVLQTFCGT